jgi:hypothetical protein
MTDITGLDKLAINTIRTLSVDTAPVSRRPSPVRITSHWARLRPELCLIAGYRPIQ